MVVTILGDRQRSRSRWNFPPKPKPGLLRQAEARGLPLDAYLRAILVSQAEAEQPPMQAVSEMILARMRNVPPEIEATMPSDGASQHDHYIYGWPKKEA